MEISFEEQHIIDYLIEILDHFDIKPKQVQSQPFAIVINDYYPPQAEPQRDESGWIAGKDHPNHTHENDQDDTLTLMARAPRPHAQHSPSSPEADSDLETHLPTSSASPISEHERLQSVQVYDLRSNFGSGRIQTQPPEFAFAGAHRILRYTPHEIANIFTTLPSPKDLAALRIQPLLVTQHNDINIGDNPCGILVELHCDTFESVSRPLYYVDALTDLQIPAFENCRCGPPIAS